MRLRIIARSLAVILAAPLVALPAGFAGEEPAGASHAGAGPAPDHAEARASQPTAGARVAAQSRANAASRPLSKAVAGPVVEVSVTCGKDGCVVQNGLEMFVATRP